MSSSYIGAAVGAALALLCGPARAGVFTDDLSRCMVSSSSPEDQAALMRWLFSAFSANPRLQEMVSITQAQRDGYNKATAQLFQRLLVKDCRKQAVAALKYEGSSAMESSFGVLGEVAAQGIMSDPKAAAETAKLGEFVDDAELGKLFVEAGIATEPAPKK